MVGSVAGGGRRDKGIRDNRGVRDLPMGGEEEVNNGVRGSVYGGGRGGSDILYGSEIKRDTKKQGQICPPGGGQICPSSYERKIN